MSDGNWKRGRGRLGVFQPLLGIWETRENTVRGPLLCRRRFEQVLDQKFIQLQAEWIFGDPASPASTYQEHAYFGTDPDKKLVFSSFTSDGKQATGWQSEAEDCQDAVLCLEADMPAGRARQLFFPNADGGWNWVVESRSKKGWNRFVDHHYKAGG